MGSSLTIIRPAVFGACAAVLAERKYLTAAAFISNFSGVQSHYLGIKRELPQSCDLASPSWG